MAGSLNLKGLKDMVLRSGLEFCLGQGQGLEGMVGVRGKGRHYVDEGPRKDRSARMHGCLCVCDRCCSCQGKGNTGGSMRVTRTRGATHRSTEAAAVSR